MKDPELTRWCQIATAKIRFTPDREAVCEELLQHMEDKYDALMDTAVPEAEIPEQILLSMGNAEELAPQLAAIHRPFWGYLERITRYMAYAMAALLCVALLSFASGYVPDLIEDLFQEERTENDIVLDPDITVWQDGYLLRLDRFTAFRDGPDEAALSLAVAEIDVFSLLLSETGLSAIHDFWAEDDLGNYYYSSNDATYKDPRISCNSPRLGLFHFSYELIVWHFDTDAKWLRLHYDRDGRNITLHIDLTGGAEE